MAADYTGLAELLRDLDAIDTEDADLIAACQRAERLHGHRLVVEKTAYQDQSDDAAMDAIHEAIEPVYEALARICEIEPRGAAGVAAVARLVLFLSEAFRPISPDAVDDSLHYVPETLIRTVLLAAAGDSYEMPPPKWEAAAA